MTSRPSYAGPPGFTLVEVLVVILVLSLAAGVVAPALLGPGGRGDAEQAAEDVVALLRAARRTAVEEGITVSVRLDPATGRYWVAEGDGGHRHRAAGRVSLVNGVRLVAAEPRPRFTFLAVGGASGEVVLVQGPADQALVRVDPWTGDPRVERP
jgi:type II secretion system protein H